MRLTLCFAACMLAASAASAQPRIGLPAQSLPGAVVRITVNAPSSDSIAGITGQMSGESLHFHAVSRGVWHAIGAVSADAKDGATATVFVEHASGTVDSLNGVTRIPKASASSGKRRALAVSKRFTQPLDSGTQARVKSGVDLTRLRSYGLRRSFAPGRRLSPVHSVPDACSTAPSQAGILASISGE